MNSLIYYLNQKKFIFDKKIEKNIKSNWSFLINKITKTNISANFVKHKKLGKINSKIFLN